MIRFTFIHNATGIIEINGQRILLDPWLTKSRPPFFGAWYHWPPLPDDIIERIGDCDVIWISHCHEDHYHLPSLRAYMRRWGNKPISTATMRERAIADGFALGTIENSATFVAKNGIDSALAVFNSERESIVNMTDVHYDQEMIDKILHFCSGPPTIALLPFAGAGPWPQTYYTDPEVLAAKAKEKQAMFKDRFVQFRDALQPKIAIPFAGQYALGGKLAHLNKWRGMNDAVDMPEPRFVLPLGATGTWEDGEFDTDDERFVRFPQPEGFPTMQFDYHLDQAPEDLRGLLNLAWERCQPSPCTLTFNWGYGSWGRSPDCEQEMHIKIDAGLLYILLTEKAHWADADAGSHYTVTRHPDVYDKSVMDWLWSFHV